VPHNEAQQLQKPKDEAGMKREHGDMH
jgi:hypothetical protein